MNDGNVERASRDDVRHLIFDRRRDDERGAVGTEPAPVLRQHLDAEPLELGAQGRALAAVEGAVAAARFAAGHRLELGERAHAGAAEPRVVEAAFAARVGDASRIGRRDEYEIAFAQADRELTHALIGEAHAAM